MRVARTCYDHLAGRVTDALIANEHISCFDNHFRLSPSGERALACIGVELPKRGKNRTLSVVAVSIGASGVLTLGVQSERP
jgi:hypothetical protein